MPKRYSVGCITSIRWRVREQNRPSGRSVRRGYCGPHVGGLREIGWTSFGTPTPPLVQLVVEPFPEDGSAIDQYLKDLVLVVDRVRSGASKAEGGLGYVE